LEKTSSAVQAAQQSGTVENFAQGYQDYLQAPLQVRLFHSDYYSLNECFAYSH
jgi:hypothetical protein